MIARVFPVKTSVTPIDEYAFVGFPPFKEFLPEDITEIHVSCTFTWDKLKAEEIAEAWNSIKVAPVKLGGVAYNSPTEEFTPGLYMKKGYTITSRGCNNHCWFCLVPEREGYLRELEIKEGNLLQDNNLLQCSDEHIRNVFAMLKTQKETQLVGGIEAKKLKDWHCELMADSKISKVWFAYDTPDDLEPLIEASKLLKAQKDWYRWWKCGCYCLVGYPNDTIEKAEERLLTALKLGFSPFAMFYRDPENKQIKTKEWANFQRSWCREAAINATRRRII